MNIVLIRIYGFMSSIFINTECNNAKLRVDCEVYGLFSDLLPAAAEEVGGELEWGRARQGLIPDFRMRLSTPEGINDCLA